MELSIQKKNTSLQRNGRRQYHEDPLRSRNRSAAGFNQHHDHLAHLPTFSNGSSQHVSLDKRSRILLFSSLRPSSHSTSFVPLNVMDRTEFISACISALVPRGNLPLWALNNAFDTGPRQRDGLLEYLMPRWKREYKGLQ